MQPNRPRRSGKGTSDHKAWCWAERRRSVIERGLVRIIATGGIIGVAAILGAVLRRRTTEIADRNEVTPSARCDRGVVRR